VIQANINKLGDLDLINLDGNTPGSSDMIAYALDDPAGIIEDIGMEYLFNQLDLDCTFSKLFLNTLDCYISPNNLPSAGKVFLDSPALYQITNALKLSKLQFGSSFCMIYWVWLDFVSDSEQNLTKSQLIFRVLIVHLLFGYLDSNAQKNFKTCKGEISLMKITFCNINQVFR
jgi:hypothetical protein